VHSSLVVLGVYIALHINRLGILPDYMIVVGRAGYLIGANAMLRTCAVKRPRPISKSASTAVWLSDTL